MKNAAIKIPILGLACLIMAAGLARAQNVCTPDCPGTPFTGTYYASVPAPPPFTGCTMNVQYKKRLACGIWHDIQVTSITFGAGCTALISYLNDPAVNIAYKMSLMSQMQNLASVGVITQEFLSQYNSTPPDQQPTLQCPNGTTIWRASKGSCWFYDTHDCGQTWEVRSCPTSACCLHQFTLCMGDDGVHMTLTGTIVPTVTCGDPENPGSCAIEAGDGHCYFACDNAGIENLIPPIQKHPDEDPKLSQEQKNILPDGSVPKQISKHSDKK